MTKAIAAKVLLDEKEEEMTESLDREKVHECFEEIRKSDAEGLLRPRAIVDAARDPNHLLHSRFEWDDTIAAEHWRVRQARKLIQWSVEDVGREGETMPVYVSLSEDRHNKNGGGYRKVEEMDSEALIAQLTATAKMELESWMRRHERLVNTAKILEEVLKERKKKAGGNKPTVMVTPVVAPVLKKKGAVGRPRKGIKAGAGR